MAKAKGLAFCLGVCFVFAIAALPARADSICADDMVVKLKHTEDQVSNLADVGRAGTGVITFTEHFQNNRGGYFGFSMASANRGGVKSGLFQKPRPDSKETTPNPEPAAVFLLGTGLAAVGAYARKRFRKER
jgi:hypothetical protein